MGVKNGGDWREGEKRDTATMTLLKKEVKESRWGKEEQYVC